jgi:hypothetical protein
MLYYRYPEIHGLPSAVIPALVGVRHGLREAMSYDATASEASRIRARITAMGLYSGIGGRHRYEKERFFLYIARQSKVVSQCLRAERHDPEALGRMFGYPECCISSFLQRWRRHKTDANTGEPDFPYLAYSDTRRRPWPEVNNLLWYMNDSRTPYYLISHFPCSYRCQKSLDYAKNVDRFISVEYPRLAQRIRAYLCLPILLFHDKNDGIRDENNGFVFSGKSDGQWIIYNDVHPLRTARSIRAFIKGNRFHNMSRKINIYDNGQLVSSIPKKHRLEAVILRFDP